MPNWKDQSSYSIHTDGSELTAEDVEFGKAVEIYKKKFGRRYPTLAEYLHILHCLGYRRTVPATKITRPVPIELKSECKKSSITFERKSEEK